MTKVPSSKVKQQTLGDDVDDDDAADDAVDLKRMILEKMHFMTTIVSPLADAHIVRLKLSKESGELVTGIY